MSDYKSRQPISEEGWERAQRAATLIQCSSAIAATKAAATLAVYLDRVRPDLQDSAALIQELGSAIRASIPESLLREDATVDEEVPTMPTTPEPESDYNNRYNRASRPLDLGSAEVAAEAATILANYLERNQPDLAETIASIRGIGTAIRATIPATKISTP